MYDRYKTKRRNTGIYKVAVLLIIAAGVIFAGIRYSRYLAFWRYDQNKLLKKVEAARMIRDTQKKREALADLADSFERYKGEHVSDPEAYYLAGEIHYLLGETYLSGSFSELFINDKIYDAGKEAKQEFIKAMKNLKKGSALDEGKIDDAYRFVLARASYYADYNSPGEIFSLIEPAGDSVKLRDVENVRFYSISAIINRKEDQGLAFLSQHGMVKDSIQGLLFYATAERLAKKYTGAIVTYKNVLTRTGDDRIKKLVHVNLGKVYFNQSLYRESLDQFTLALKMDEKDAMPKIWIGKNYFAMGEKDKAKAIWSEILTIDGSNREVRNLMGTM